MMSQSIIKMVGSLIVVMVMASITLNENQRIYRVLYSISFELNQVLATGKTCLSPHVGAFPPALFIHSFANVEQLFDIIAYL